MNIERDVKECKQAKSLRLTTITMNCLYGLEEHKNIILEHRTLHTQATPVHVILTDKEIHLIERQLGMTIEEVEQHAYNNYIQTVKEVTNKTSTNRLATLLDPYVYSTLEELIDN